MERGQSSGFIEKEHTADWELHVWAPNLPELLEQSAQGMYHLMDAHLGRGANEHHQLQIEYGDNESLLVSFLSELLYLLESKSLVFSQFDWSLQPDSVMVTMVGKPLASFTKEIKAVTYHNLTIRQTNQGLEADVVFDI